ncbi:MAG: TolC family protein [Chitinophagales bacterium]|nr:TolC family protein [Chitinophagales bacterium]
MIKRLFLVFSFFLFLKSFSFAQTRVWTLQDCIKYAIENNVSIKKAELDQNSTEINYKQTKYNKLPNFSGNANGSFSNGAAIDPITSNFQNQQIFSNNFSLNSSTTLYQGNFLNLQIEKNKILLQKSDLYIEEAKNSITLSVIESYLQALYYNESITIAENILKSSQEELRQTQIKFTNGAISQLELSNMETQNATNEYNVVVVKNQYEQQVLALKQLLELDPTTHFEIENIKLDNISIVIPNKQEVFERAIIYLPDLKIYDLTKQTLEKDIKIAKTAYYPTVSLGLGLGTGYTNTMSYDYASQLNNNFKQQVSLLVNIPIFSKMQNKTNVSLAKIQLQQNDLDKAVASKTLYSKIETAYQNAVANVAQATAAQATRDNAKLAYELASKKFELGGLTVTDLSVSRNTYINAEQSNLQSKYLTILYRQLLKFYNGEEVDNIN